MDNVRCSGKAFRKSNIFRFLLTTANPCKNLNKSRKIGSIATISVAIATAPSYGGGTETWGGSTFRAPIKNEDNTAKSHWICHLLLMISLFLLLFAHSHYSQKIGFAKSRSNKHFFISGAAVCSRKEHFEKKIEIDEWSGQIRRNLQRIDMYCASDRILGPPAEVDLWYPHGGKFIHHRGTYGNIPSETRVYSELYCSFCIEPCVLWNIAKTIVHHVLLIHCRAPSAALTSH